MTRIREEEEVAIELYMLYAAAVSLKAVVHCNFCEHTTLFIV